MCYNVTMDWKVITTDDFDEWFVDQNQVVQIEVTASVEVLKEIGPHLGRPLVDTLKGSKFANMKELRVKANNQVIRVTFAFDPKQQAILLTAGAKQGKSQARFYKALISKADTLYKQHLDDIQGEKGR